MASLEEAATKYPNAFKLLSSTVPILAAIVTAGGALLIAVLQSGGD